MTDPQKAIPIVEIVVNELPTVTPTIAQQEMLSVKETHRNKFKSINHNRRDGSR